MDFNKFSEGSYKLEGNHNFEDRLQVQDWMIRSTLKSIGQLPGTHSLNLYSADFPQYCQNCTFNLYADSSVLHYCLMRSHKKVFKTKLKYDQLSMKLNGDSST